MSGFREALPFTLHEEGGYVVDTGGPTMAGVTQDTFTSWLGEHGQPIRPVSAITPEERDAIYHSRYWVAAHCDALPWPMSMVHFDCAVNAGVGKAVAIIQAATGATADGVWGPETTERVNRAMHDPEGLMERMLWGRVQHYYELASKNGPKYGRYLVGWIGRTIRLRRRAWDAW